MADNWQTVLDGWTITLKQNEMFQRKIHPEICYLDSKWPSIGHYSLSHAQYVAECVRWLDHHNKTKFEVAGEHAHIIYFL